MENWTEAIFNSSMAHLYPAHARNWNLPKTLHSTWGIPSGDTATQLKSTEFVQRLEGQVEYLLQWTQQHGLIKKPSRAAAAARPETIVEDPENES